MDAPIGTTKKANGLLTDALSQFDPNPVLELVELLLQILEA